MSDRAFQFGMQAALDRAKTDLQACEAAHAQSLRLLRDEEAAAARCRRTLEQTRAKITAARDVLASPRAGRVEMEDLARVNRWLTGLRALEDRQSAALTFAGKRVDLAAASERLRKRELEVAFNQARAMERVRQAREAQHRITARRAADRAEEETAQRAWGAARP